MREPFLFVVIVVFAIFLVWQLVVTSVSRRRRRKERKMPLLPEGADPSVQRVWYDLEQRVIGPRDAIRRIRQQVPTLDDPRARAAGHLAWAFILRDMMLRDSAAARHFLKALDEDPSNVHALSGLRELLSHAPAAAKRVERACWKALSRIPESEIGGPVWVRLWASLASLYAASSATVPRSDAIQRMLRTSGRSAAADPDPSA